MNPGTAIGHYEILERLGGGGMGVVYKALDSRLRRTVAMKFLPAHLSDDDEVKARFVQEAQAASALDHANICTIYEIGETDERELYIVMAYYHGQTLKYRIGSEDFTVDRALDVACQLARALDRAHEAGIVHRDVKPANIMVTDRGEVKLLDFGLAKLVGGADLTTAGSTLGTAAYMSPEQVKSEEIGPAADLWSFGVVLYEMLTGKQPFAGDYEQAIMYAILNQEPPPADKINPQVPRNVAVVVSRCMAKSIEDRPPSAHDVLVALGDSTERIRSTPGATSSASRRMPNTVTSIIIVIIAAIAITSIIALLTYRAAPEGTSSHVSLKRQALTQHFGNERWPSLSPDGSQLAYSWTGADNDDYDIYVGVIGEESPIQLTNSAAHDIAPSYSPDGRSLSFLRHTDSATSLMVMGALGGSERRVADLRLTNSKPVWHPGGDWLIVSERFGPTAPFYLVAISLSSGERIRLTDPPDSLVANGDQVQDILPDGTALLFYRGRSFSVSDLYMLELPEQLVQTEQIREPRILTQGIVRTVPDDVFSANSGAVFAGGEVLASWEETLWRVSVAGTSDPDALATVGPVGYMDLSTNGKKLAMEKVVAPIRSVVSVVELGVQNPVPRRFLPWTTFTNDIRFSPDGARVVFESDRSGVSQIWIAASDGSAVRQLTFPEGSAGTPRWSPDGKMVVYDRREGGTADIFVVPADGGTPRRITNHPSDDMIPSWSRNGEWIYFCSTRTGSPQIWKIRQDGSQANQVTYQGGYHGMESIDGRYLYYSKEDAPMTELWRIGTDGEGESVFHTPLFGWRSFDLSSNGKVIVGRLLREQNQLSFDEIDPVTRMKSEIARVSLDARTRFEQPHGLSVSPDGRIGVFTTETEPEFDLELIEGQW